MESYDGRFIYYSREFTLRSLWRVTVEGGKEKLVLGDFPFNRYPENLVAGSTGLYFRGELAQRGAQVWFLPFSGPPIPQLLAQDLPLLALGIAVSPDERRLLLAGFVAHSSDIVAVKGFR